MTLKDDLKQAKAQEPIVDPDPLPEIEVIDTPMAPKPDPSAVSRRKEIAELYVRNSIFTNWTSVRVEARITEAFPIFQFECSEEADIPLRMDTLQFVPGDIVRVKLGGAQVLFGYITERHVAYDSKNHAVRIVGCGDTVDLTSSSVPMEQLNGHDGKSWTQLARDLAAHLNINIENFGAVDNTPYENIQIQPGEKIIDAIERYAKDRNIVIGSNPNGGLIGIGEHPANPKGVLTEGVHILRANCVVRDQMVYKRIFAIGQTTGSNKAYGDSQNKMICHEDGTSTRNRHLVTLTDVADTQHGVCRRAKMEKTFSEGSIVEAQITVQGWFKDNNVSNQIWRAGDYYTVNSPSLILNNEVLGCAGCVYEQNNSGGTTTTLQMVNPIHMNGILNVRKAVQIWRDRQRAEQEELARKRREEGNLR